ncbi:hypothetical protein [Halorubrum sp. SD683]|uniref:hypothetical protein n=1 Tax=Halorubrum sp. SD683 TaxID=1855873 RepID=UPI00117BD01D|nr:hypothetical protein [Halorubrum sp. SD683]
MNRRALLVSLGGVGAVGLAGYSFLSGDLPPIESKQVKIENSQCVSADERKPQASMSYDPPENTLTVDGVTATPSDCTDLFINPIGGTGRKDLKDDAYEIVVDFGSAGSCDRCPAETTYSATVEFGHNPSALYIYHTEEIDDRLRPVGPYASEQIR